MGSQRLFTAAVANSVRCLLGNLPALLGFAVGGAGTTLSTYFRRLGDHSQTETTLRHPDGTEERTVSGSENFEKVWADRRGGEPEAGTY